MVHLERDVRPNQVEFDYPVMSEQELEAFAGAIGLLARDDCHMFMWTTQKFLPVALRLVDCYGFRYVHVMRKYRRPLYASPPGSKYAAWKRQASAAC
jgi:hypothetical protein